MVDKSKLYLELAYELASSAFDNFEVPVGAILVKDDVVISKACNSMNANDNPLEHAEVKAISEALKTHGSSYVKGSTLYVTLEPCLMCLGALVNSGVSHVYFGALDKNEGAFSKHGISLTMSEIDVHYIEMKKCGEIMQDFFKKVRSDT